MILLRRKIPAAVPRLALLRAAGSSVLVLLLAGLAAAAVPSSAAVPPRIRIAPGERLYYSATWLLLPAGHALLTLGRRGPRREITFSAASTGVVSVLFPVRDQIESFYHRHSFCTQSTHKDTLEGRRKLRTRIVFHTHARFLQLHETRLQGSRTVSKNVTRPIPGCVLDLFTALYYVRSLPLKIGEVYNFPVNEGGRTVEVKLVPDLRETVITPAGTFHTIRAVPHIFHTAVFHRPGKMWIWFSDDKLHLPVMVKAQVQWGTIIAHLTRYVEPR